jgi:hypothetical protein
MNKILLSLFFVLFAFSSVSSAATVTIDEAHLNASVDNVSKPVGIGFSDEHELNLNALNPGNTGFKLTFTLVDTVSNSIEGLKGELWNSAGTIKLLDILANVGSNPLPPMAFATGSYLLKVIGTNVLDSFGFQEQQYSLDVNAQAVPVPAAIWLFGSALMGLAGFSRRKTN